MCCMRNETPLQQRFIMTVAPGFMFGETSEVKCPKESWDNPVDLAHELKSESKVSGDATVGFRRFIYSPEHGQLFKDKGWVYFKGVKVSKEAALSGRAKARYPNIPLTDIAISNIKCNNWDCLYIEEYNKLWPLQKGDMVVQ